MTRQTSFTTTVRETSAECGTGEVGAGLERSEAGR